nr:MAG TPA: hypothetical protein [Caudoviricetes sp.]
MSDFPCPILYSYTALTPPPVASCRGIFYLCSVNLI